jgi:magnesium transporter
MLWAMCDEIVDAYFPLGDGLGDAMDAAQDEVIRAPRPEVLERVFRLKRELHDIRRLVSPAREVFNQLTNRDIGLIDADEIVYFRDVYDHLIRLTDELDNYRELAAATLDVYLTQINNNLSVIMKRLTGVTVILAGVGAIAGIFGMSEAGAALAGLEAAGFWIVTAGTVTLAVIAAYLLHRIDWI